MLVVATPVAVVYVVPALAKVICVAGLLETEVTVKIGYELWKPEGANKVIVSPGAYRPPAAPITPPVRGKPPGTTQPPTPSTIISCFVFWNIETGVVWSPIVPTKAETPFGVRLYTFGPETTYSTPCSGHIPRIGPGPSV